MKSIVKPWHLVLLGMILIVLTALVIRGCYVEYKLKQNVRDVSASMKRLDKDLAMATSKVTSLSKAKAKLDKRIKQLLDQRGDLLQEITRLKAELNAKGEGKIIVKWKVKEKVVEKVKIKKVYVQTENGNQHEVTSIPFEFEDFRLTIKGDALKKTLKYQLHQRFVGQVVRALRNDRSVVYLTLYELDDKGNKVSSIKITDLEFTEVDKRANRLSFDLNLDLSILAGIDISNINYNISADFGVSFFSYGRKGDDIIRLLRLSVGIDNVGGGDTVSAHLGIAPIYVNISRYIPLFNDLYIGPVLYYSIPGNSYGVLIGIGSTL